MIKSIVLFALIVFSSPAFSFEVVSCEGKDVRWEGDTTLLRASKQSFPANSSWKDALGTSVDLWNQNPSKFRFTLSFNDDGVWTGNGENEVWFTDSDDQLSGAPALASMMWDCVDWWIVGVQAKLSEVDVLFDSRKPWTPFMSDKFNLSAYGGPKRPFINTAAHELGHAVGLMHVDYLYNIMGRDWTHIHANGGKARAYIGEDAANGAVGLYEERGGDFEDVSVAHWKYKDASSAGYSIHERTEIFDMEGELHASVDINDEPRFYVLRDSDLKLEMTYENNGKSRQQNLKVGFYLSTNSRITTSDRRLGGAVVDIGRNVPVTKRHKVHIPADLAPGTTYYLGVIVDEENEIDEIVEANNATYTMIRTFNN